MYVGNSGMSTAGNLRAAKAQHFSEDPCCSVIFVIQYLLSFFFSYRVSFESLTLAVAGSYSSGTALP